MDRRLFIQSTAALAAPLSKPHSAQVKQHNNKPTIASFYALTDCIGGRFSFDEQPQ